MSDVVLQLIGGPLCGLYLPLTPRASTAPRQLIIYSPIHNTWNNYVDGTRKAGPVDVYKVRVGARLMMALPRGFKAVNMRFTGCLTGKEIECIQQLQREHGIQD